MINIVDVKSLRSTALVFYHNVMKKSVFCLQPAINSSSLKKICAFIFLRQNFEGSVFLK